MSAPEEYRGPKFVGIMGHDNVSHNGSKTTVYFVQVQVPDGGMFIVRHRYHEFKDFHDKVRATRPDVKTLCGGAVLGPSWLTADLLSMLVVY